MKFILRYLPFKFIWKLIKNAKANVDFSNSIGNTIALIGLTNNITVTVNSSIIRTANKFISFF